MNNPIYERLTEAPVNGGFRMEGYYVWCGSVVRGEDGNYHMFASRWREELGFHPHWLFNSEIVRAVSETPEGPYQFAEVVLPRRERHFFDALNQHNPQIYYWNNTYYLFYMGTTYGGPIPEANNQVPSERAAEVWNRKRIGLATATSVFGPWTRRESPLLEPREPGNWDCTNTTNPSAAILPDGTTYLIYKSREYYGSTLRLGVARAPRPEGPYERLRAEPIFQFENADYHVEDPFLWYEGGKFHLLIKDDFKNDCGGLTGEWGAGVYATSEDCLEWVIHPEPKAYSRTVRWNDGKETVQCNMERPFLLFQEGQPTHLFTATGSGDAPWQFTATWNMVIPLKKDTAESAD
ncbi:glycoside hydrolase family protein [Paenibacillus sp. strain BS8-2]